MFDASPGSGATWAAAGMLAPSAEAAPGERHNYELQRHAVAAWREVAREVREVTGEDTRRRRETGTLLVGFDASDRRLVEQFEYVAQEFDVTVERVTRESHPSFFEGLTARIRDGVFLEGDAWLDPDLAMRLLSRTPVKRWASSWFASESEFPAVSVDGQVEVRTAAGLTRGDVGLLATGASVLPKGVAEDVRHSVRPVRGMTVRVSGFDRSAQPVVRAFVRGRSFYVVSRPGGYCVLGASSDEQSELVVEVGEMQRLLRDALDVVLRRSKPLPSSRPAKAYDPRRAT